MGRERLGKSAPHSSSTIHRVTNRELQCVTIICFSHTKGHEGNLQPVFESRHSNYNLRGYCKDITLLVFFPIMMYVAMSALVMNMKSEEIMKFFYICH